MKSYAVYVLLIFTPIAVILELLHVGYVTLFVITAIAIIPLAKLIGDSTEHLSTHYGSTLGSLINVTFGNAAEIIIAVVAINAGLLESCESVNNWFYSWKHNAYFWFEYDCWRIATEGTTI